MTQDNPDEIIEERFDSFLFRYQINLETLMRGSDFIFYCINLIHYKCHKISFKCRRSYIDSPDQIKKGKRSNKPKNDDNKCFQYAATLALNQEQIQPHDETVSNVKSFMNICNC